MPVNIFAHLEHPVFTWPYGKIAYQNRNRLIELYRMVISPIYKTIDIVARQQITRELRRIRDPDTAMTIGPHFFIEQILVRRIMQINI